MVNAQASATVTVGDEHLHLTVSTYVPVSVAERLQSNVLQGGDNATLQLVDPQTDEVVASCSQATAASLRETAETEERDRFAADPLAVAILAALTEKWSYIDIGGYGDGWTHDDPDWRALATDAANAARAHFGSATPTR